MSPRSRYWAVLAITGAAYEVWAITTDHHTHTLSAFTRDVFRTDTTAGRYAFTLTWGGFAAWYGHHILTGGHRAPLPHRAA